MSEPKNCTILSVLILRRLLVE